ncbi:MAG: hypothetical protein C5B54_03770 [Acidobacteria bacterium]|nr:MAG: hypothetical protein C5B54_03770 [Acidobacteriota bacterium]
MLKQSKVRILFSLCMSVLLAVFFLACSQGSNDTSKTSGFGDARITASVKAKFAKDDLVKARNIDVDTDQGQVSLRGTVTSQVEADRAVQLAQSVDGVRNVRSYLKTEPENTSSTSTGDSLKNEANKTEESLKRTADNAAEKTKDAAITAEVKLKLAKDKNVTASDINVDTNNGEVTLNGTVGSKAEERRAIQLARTVDDVKVVHSNLTVKTTG